MAQITIIEEKKTFEPFVVQIKIETREELEQLRNLVGATSNEVLFNDDFYDILIQKLNQFV